MYGLSRLNSASDLVDLFAAAATYPKRSLRSISFTHTPRRSLATAGSGVCDVYLLGYTRSCPKSWQEFQSAVQLKPQVVFVELCQNDARAANEEAMKYGAKVILGDRPIGYMSAKLLEVACKHNSGAITCFKRIGNNLLRTIFVQHMRKQSNTVSRLYLVIDLLGEKAMKYGAKIILGDRPIRYMYSKLLEVAHKHNSVVKAT